MRFAVSWEKTAPESVIDMKKARIVTKRCLICNKEILPHQDVVYLIATYTDLAAPHHVKCINKYMSVIRKEEQ